MEETIFHEGVIPMALAVAVSEVVTGTKPLCLKCQVIGDWEEPFGSDRSRCHAMREILSLSLEGLSFRGEQLNNLKLWLGEALANAFEHTVEGGFVTATLKVSPCGILITIVNTSNGYSGEDLDTDILEEKGRGRKMMGFSVADLRKSGLHTEDGCEFVPCRGLDCGQTVVSLSLVL